MGSQRQRIEAKLSSFIREWLVDEEPASGDPLASDAVDSLGLEQLALYIEHEFGVTIDGEEIDTENFASISTLAALIESKSINPRSARR